MRLKCPACAAAFLAAAFATAASSATVANPGFGGSLALPGATFSITLAEPGWSATHGGVDGTNGKPSTFRVRAIASQLYVCGSASFSETPDGGVHAEWTATADTDIPIGELFVSTGLPIADYAGGKAVLDGGAREVALPDAAGKDPQLFRGEVSSLSLIDRDGAERLSVAFDVPTEILLQDNRKWKNESFALRLVVRRDATMRAGETSRLAATFRTPVAGPLALGPKRTWRLEPGPEWTPVATEPWIAPGSALDFSGVVPHHSPAGKFGRVVAVGDHFEFEKLPGVPQRFYGVNINGEANTPTSPEAAERFAANLARMGYNTLRIHHHGRALLSKPGHYNKPNECADDTMPDPEAMDRFDALVAACVRHGIYITTDLCVSRSHYIKWRSLGIDRDGYITRIHDYKILCSFWEPAYSNLCAWSRNFLCHVNPYTGRCLAEEPALCTLALINEGNLGNYGAGALRKLPGVKEAWGKDFPAEVYADDGSTSERRHTAAFAQFLADRETLFFKRFSAFVRDELHCAAPLSNLSSWYDPVQYQLPRSLFDYVDGHSYVDHPVFLDEQWKLPSRCPNSNPLLGAAAGAPPVAFRRLMDKPFCLTEWNYSGPGRYRGVGGIATGAMGALQNWSGMWRFAWCHGLEGIESPETKRMGYFDMTGDPLSLAAERAALCLFLRGDLEPFEAEAPLVLDEATLRDPAAGAPKIGSKSRLAEAWRRRVGTRLKGAEAPRSDAGAAVLPASSASADPAAGTFLIDTPRTAGGFAENGRLVAGPLRFALAVSGEAQNTPATVWVSSLDGEPIATSSHLLLTHLTDVQNSGIEYADPDLTTLLNWGGLPHLMRNGAADVELKLEGQSSVTLLDEGVGKHSPSFTIFRLSPSGRRLGTIPLNFDPASGILHFTARTDYDPSAATFLYEIVRQP